MKIAVVIVRLLMGLMFLFASVTFLFHIFPQPQMPDGPIKTYMDGIMTVQLMPIVKVIELISGLLFVIGRYVALANILILPIILNIFLFHAFLESAEILIPALL